jgi:hypothetical protein
MGAAIAAGGTGSFTPEVAADVAPSVIMGAAIAAGGTDAAGVATLGEGVVT